MAFHQDVSHVASTTPHNKMLTHFANTYKCINDLLSLSSVNILHYVTYHLCCVQNFTVIRSVIHFTKPFDIKVHIKKI